MTLDLNAAHTVFHYTDLPTGKYKYLYIFLYKKKCIRYLEKKVLQPLLVFMEVLYPDWIGNWICLLFRREENQRKTLGTGQELTTNSAHMTAGRNRIPALLVGGKRSQHYAIPIFIRQCLSPVSIAWSDWEYCHPPSPHGLKMPITWPNINKLWYITN